MSGTNLQTIEEISKKYKVSKSWLYKRTSAREVAFFKVGRVIMFEPDEFDAFFVKRTRVEAI